jgi:hypothetical protein
MKLWLVKRPDRAEYDECDSFICAAKTEDAARETHPDYGPESWVDDAWIDGDGELENPRYGSWPVRPAAVSAVCIADHTDLPAGVVLASFNAG